MRVVIQFFSFVLIMSLFSCAKKRNYHIQGTLLNEVTGNSHDMGNESIQLIRISSSSTFDIFSNPDKSIIEAEATTDNEGHFDFGINELKKGDYKIDYVHGDGKTFYGVTNSFKEFSLDKNTEIDETIAIIPTMGGISFIANPLLTTSIYDTIYVDFVSETRLIKNPTYSIFGSSTGQELYFAPNHVFGGINNTEFMGNIFITIIKSYNGVRTIIKDTVFVEKDEKYKYYTSF